MLANEFLALEHSPLFFVDIIIHCSLLRTCRVRVEEKEEFLVYTVLWTLTCHPYLESATALSDTVSGEANFVMNHTGLTAGGFTQPSVARNLIGNIFVSDSFGCFQSQQEFFFLSFSK